MPDVMKTVYQEKTYTKPPSKNRNELTITWFGTTCELISDGETALLVDPFLTRNARLISILTNRHVLQPDPKLYDTWIAPLEESISAMAVTQSHFDHILDVGEIGKRTGAMLLGSQSTTITGTSLGLEKKQTKVIAEGEAMHYGKFRITFLKSRHSGIGVPTGITKQFTLPAGSYDMRQGGTFVLYIEHPLGNIVCNNSANYMPDLLRGFAADVIFLSIAQLPRSLDRYFQETIDMVGASRVFPVHWDNFLKPLTKTPQKLPIGANLDKFIEDASRLRPKIKVYTLPVGKPQVIYSAK
jgi:L-ascorbate metabolism protein UlaG (beta-lactamase superfamily)